MPSREAESREGDAVPCRVKDEVVTTWVKPALVVELKFAEWTSQGELRPPAGWTLGSLFQFSVMPRDAPSARAETTRRPRLAGRATNRAEPFGRRLRNARVRLALASGAIQI